MTIKRQIRRALLGLSESDSAMMFGMALHNIKPIWKRRREERAYRLRARERSFKASPTFNRVVRH